MSAFKAILILLTVFQLIGLAASFYLAGFDILLAIEDSLYGFFLVGLLWALYGVLFEVRRFRHKSKDKNQDAS